ncbi:hypothetical protein [Leeuwenhoekiella nanhaiensis]|uniref:Uncharacterized protein n=1 Tax=Leeuwenhoekiella nanhaiensis TaxID=1655491 RepID=A0A2G1VLQ6_9FLAO|nr:hypothetical protein [Leeuwenhoekiella nanhaiensis]PHQ27695.1 hypothetical protein CJ305_18690 [Leeuwenhoekiella nanhaiensis]
MIYYRFVNYDIDAIKTILESMGKVRFEKSLPNRDHKPTKMKNFKLVWNGKVCEVCYLFPGDTRYTKLFHIKEYEMPETGWVWENYRN